MKKSHKIIIIVLAVLIAVSAALYAVFSRDYAVDVTEDGLFAYVELLDKKYIALPLDYVIKSKVSDKTYKHIHKETVKMPITIDYPLYAHLFENDPDRTFMFLDSKKPHLTVNSRFYYAEIGTEIPKLKSENVESIDIYKNDGMLSTDCGELVNTITDRKTIDEVFSTYVGDNFTQHIDQSVDETYDVYFNFKDSMLSYSFGTISQRIYNIVWLNKKVEYK